MPKIVKISWYVAIQQTLSNNNYYCFECKILSKRADRKVNKTSSDSKNGIFITTAKYYSINQKQELYSYKVSHEKYFTINILHKKLKK